MDGRGEMLVADINEVASLLRDPTLSMTESTRCSHCHLSMTVEF